MLFISDSDLQRVILIPCHGVATAGLVDWPGVLLVDDLLHVADHHAPGDVVAVKLRLQDRVHAGACHDVHRPLGLGVTPEVIKLRGGQV